MRLFVGPLSELTEQQAVRDVIETAIRPNGFLAFLKKTSRRVSCTMMELPARDGRGPIYFAIVHIHPPNLAAKVIRKRNGTIIRTRSVTIREFVERDPANERRRDVFSERPWNRRSRDRRGHALLRICGSTKQAVFAPVKGFSREYRD
jgi:hypothetical protein